jgi:hypothetical protein
VTRGISQGALQADGPWPPSPPTQHVADAVLFMAALPLDANVQFDVPPQHAFTGRDETALLRSARPDVYLRDRGHGGAYRWA